MDFEKQKNAILSRKDKSRAGTIDLQIKELLEIINQNECYCTTSSCSGRIMLLTDAKKKHEVIWHFVSHEPITFEAIMNVLDKQIDKQNKEIIYFRYEPLILHILCKNVESAKIILGIAQNIGYKHSGIISLGKKIIVEIAGSEKIALVIKNNNTILLSEEGMRLHVEIANNKMEENKKRIKKFELAVIKTVKSTPC